MNSETLKDFYPPIEPYNHFMLSVSDLHTLYVEECGNPDGKPIIFLHGGPGAGSGPDHRRFFDPKYYRIIVFDQRGCGRSLPFAELKENTTWDLVSDIEKIRLKLNIKSWKVFGGSWGSTLALSYAIKYSEHVEALILRGIFLCRPSELKWFYQQGADQLFADLWEEYCNFIPENERHDFISAYYKRLTGLDEKQKLEAARIWTQWEIGTSCLEVKKSSVDEYEDPKKNLPFARIESHYFVNKAFFKTDNFILDNINQIKHIPCVIVQGRYDVVCPMTSAWQLHKNWPSSVLKIVSNAGHSAMEAGIRSELIKATDFFKA
jgi:proline iminopeptidase